MAQITDEVAPKDTGPHNILVPLRRAAGVAWHRSRMNWPGISSANFSCLFPQTES